MPRGGGGHMGGGHMGGSHHSSFSGRSHSGGSHSSFRGSSHSSFSSGPHMNRRPGMGPGPRPRPFFGGFWGPRYYGGFWGPRYHGGIGGLILLPFVIIFGVFMLLGFIFSMIGSHSEPADNYSYSTNGYKYDSSYSFTSDCVNDELGWISSESTLVDGLENFYDSTGVQPYVWIAEADTTDSDQLWDEACDYYENHIDNEEGFLYVYYYDADEPEAENDYYVLGFDVEDYMDDDAINEFWNAIDANISYGDSTNFDIALANAFTEAGNNIGVNNSEIIADPEINTAAKSTKSISVFSILGSIFGKTAIIAGVIAIVALIVSKITKKKKSSEETVYDSTDTDTENYNPYYGDSESYSESTKTQNKD